MNILLCSAGRRPYLVAWFKQALLDNGMDGKIIAADLDPYSAASAFADEFIQAPSAASEEYKPWLLDLLRKKDISLAVSVNDFELSEWSEIAITPQTQPLIRLDPPTQALVEDKLEMSSRLKALNIPTPRTWSGSEAHSLRREPGDYVVKGRFGSASRGLHFTDANGLEGAVSQALLEVTTRQGILANEQTEFIPQDLVIIQEKISGTEFGLDVVSDLNTVHAGVLARRKISMRAGETYRAVSVNAEPFEILAQAISEVVPHRGLIDVDVMMDANNNPFVIDINPRFGGGYPFSHLATAKVPSLYVAWASGKQPQDSWLKSVPGITSSKYVEAVIVDGN